MANTENTKLKIWLPFLLSAMLVAGMFIGFKMGGKMPRQSFFNTDKPTPIQEITTLIKERYVDDVNVGDLTDTAVMAMLARLDPHSTFIPAKKIQQVNDEIKGSFYGIGVEFIMLDDTLHVTNVLPKGPAAVAGLQIGDKILKAADSTLSGKKLEVENIRQVLRGSLGSSVTVQLLRGKTLQSATIKRDIIPLESLDAGYMITDSIGFIRLNRFSTQTYKEFMKRLLELKSKGMKNLILDLRDNGGGVLDEAVEIADEFLAGDKLITYTEGKHVQKKEYRCRRKGQFETGGLVVLVNENTASASEILLGALQDWDRATLVGRRTFGKGLVQDQYTLSDNSALRLTTARYFTPIGRSIQRSYQMGNAAYYHEMIDRYAGGELVNGNRSKADTSKKFKTMGGKTVYGNGGITPDYFVATDTAAFGKTTAKLFSKGTITDFGYRYFMLNSKSLLNYKSAADFVKNYSLDTYSWLTFEEMALVDSVGVKNLSSKERMYIDDALKLSLARQLFRNEGFYETLNQKDAVVRKALEILKALPITK